MKISGGRKLAENSQETGTPSQGRGPGQRFQPGVSGNAGGRPKGSKTFAIRDLGAEAINDPTTRAYAVAQLKANLTGRRSNVPALEFLARLNREIGLGSDQQSGVTIHIVTNIDPMKLRRKPEKGAQRKGIGTRGQPR